MKTIVSATEDCIRAAAEQILSVLREKPNAALVLDAGDDVLCLLRRSAALAKEQAISLSGVRCFAVCEFEGLAPDDPTSVRSHLGEILFSAFDAKEENFFVPDAADPAVFDEQVHSAGGIDLAVLGLGENARVGFNEPATQFDTHTHVQKLTDRTRKELAPRFGGEDSVPQRGVTMGFRELCAAREIIVIALGEQKSKAVFHMLYGRDDSVYPAAFLQLPPNVTVYADSEAAKQLDEKSFDAVVFNGD